MRGGHGLAAAIYNALCSAPTSDLSCICAEVIDFEEFVKETPKTLRTSLVKLAKQNGHDLGFLA